MVSGLVISQDILWHHHYQDRLCWVEIRYRKREREAMGYGNALPYGSTESVVITRIVELADLLTAMKSLSKQDGRLISQLSTCGIL